MFFTNMMGFASNESLLVSMCSLVNSTDKNSFCGFENHRSLPVSFFVNMDTGLEITI